jgi:hypothetical protein
MRCSSEPSGTVPAQTRQGSWAVLLRGLCFEARSGPSRRRFTTSNAEQRRTIRRFLGKTLAGDYNARRLLNLIWKSADAGPAEPKDAVRFLELIRNSIDDEGRIVPPA